MTRSGKPYSMAFDVTERFRGDSSGCGGTAHAKEGRWDETRDEHTPVSIRLRSWCLEMFPSVS